MVRFSLVTLAAAAMLLPTAGCGSFGSIFDVLQPSVVTVRLVNTNSSFGVNVELYYGGDQNALEAILTSLGTRREFTIAPNDTAVFTADCDDLQAIIIANATLRIIGNTGPDTDTGVYRDGTDFNCRDTLVFTFTGQIIPPGLNVAFTPQ